MKKPTVRNCDGCNTKLHPDRTLDMGISGPGEPEVMYHVCYGCALKLGDGDKELDAIVMANGRKRALASGSIAGVLAA